VRISVPRSALSLIYFTRWIYAQFIAVDANFKLKSKNRQIKDPELGSGWSYFVENTAYTRHVANNPHEEDVRIFQISDDMSNAVPRLRAAAANSTL
jgi:hypothetical protein